MNKKLLVIVNHYVTVNLAGRLRESFVWDKLSNSGDALKLLIPNYSLKIISGPINNGCMVIIQEIIEKAMGNRGSKSVMLDCSTTVKEQRVDGYTGSIPVLRCARFNLFAKLTRANLMGSERNYQTKTPSNRNIQLRSFSSVVKESKFESISP
jgi:hypothetical protein